MSGAIFIIQNDETLVEMTQRPYEKEDHLQRFLERYPALLAGDQVDTHEPRRWLLVVREMPIPDREDASGRWSLDHLFLDQDGIPTLVEVKRSTDTRIRREVVGQMLDYAANALLNWPSDEIRSQFQNRCRSEDVDPDEELRRCLGSGIEPERYWTSVKTNLDAHRIRLLFVADEIPDELKRIIEFLNGQMKSTEVLGVELRQYEGQNLKTLVPRVIGITADAQQAKSQRPSSRIWDEPKFLNEIQQKTDEPTRNIAIQILEWARSRGFAVKYGRGATVGTFYPTVRTPQGECSLFGVSTSGKIDFVFKTLPLSSDDERFELLQALNKIPGVDLPTKAVQSWASFTISVLHNSGHLKQFLATCEWIIEHVSPE